MTCRGELIRIVSLMMTDRVAVGHTCRLLADQASEKSTRLTVRSEMNQERSNE